ncbi:MAG: flagellar basal body-associated FliL family protein [Acidobacteria bacterium]|nr:flagellar basal body-associated FliL family protein [Acidobacteriota bacterium]
MDAEKDPQEKSNGPSRLVLILIAALLVAVVSEGGYIGYLMLYGQDKKTNTAAKSETKERKPKNKGEEGGRKGAKSALTLEPFLVNLADTPQNRYARITMKLGLSMPPDHVTEKIVKNDVVVAKIRDQVLSLLCSKRSDEIMSEKGKQILRKQIMEQATKALPEGSVEEVFFTDFVVQL